MSFSRFFEPDRGKILIGGIDIKEISLQTLREIITIVPQEPILFNNSISYNIAYGLDEISEAKIIWAA